MKNFVNSIGDNVISKIRELTDLFFSLFSELVQWQENKRQLEDQHPEFKNVPSGKKTGWYFLLFGLVPVSVLIDYSSIFSFIHYLAATTGGGIVSTIISTLGFAVFLLLELSVGYMILFSKQPLTKIMGYLLAVALVLVPAYLIYTTYEITEEKTSLLYHKTIALMAFSILIHVMLFLLIREIWNGINYLVFRRKLAILNRRAPLQRMAATRTELQSLYIHFDRQTVNTPSEQRQALLPARAWYLKEKLTNGISTDDFGLSNYNPNGVYIQAPNATATPIGFQTTKN